MAERLSLTPERIEEFIARHRLPERFAALVADHYLPLLHWVVDRMGAEESMLLGINGAQGSGKSTLADFISFALSDDSRAPVAVLSIDDFYLTRSERERSRRSASVIKTRGVPGTHDTRMLAAVSTTCATWLPAKNLPCPGSTRRTTIAPIRRRGPSSPDRST